MNNRHKINDVRSWNITVKMTREYEATIAVLAGTQDEADRKALDKFNEYARKKGLRQDDLGLPAEWDEHEICDHDPEICQRFRCVDCGKDVGNSGEYFMVSDEVWAASGLAPNGGMLCLRCLERRIGRELTEDDFTAVWPLLQAWESHLAARAAAHEDLDAESSPVLVLK
jgi:hypothetical protein